MKVNMFNGKEAFGSEEKRICREEKACRYGSPEWAGKRFGFWVG
jgi:hypothetical protein